MWLDTDAAKTARPGQFISMYTKNAGKLLPRPISICEIDREGGKLRVVYLSLIHIYTEGTFSGIGATMTLEESTGLVEVVNVYPD